MKAIYKKGGAMSDTKIITIKASKKKGGKGSRKIGRSKVKCAFYKAKGQREKNKARKARKEAKIRLQKATKKLARMAMKMKKEVK